VCNKAFQKCVFFDLGDLELLREIPDIIRSWLDIISDHQPTLDLFNVVYRNRTNLLIVLHKKSLSCFGPSDRESPLTHFHTH